jgi:hypothetical protein
MLVKLCVILLLLVFQMDSTPMNSYHHGGSFYIKGLIYEKETCFINVVSTTTQLGFQMIEFQNSTNGKKFLSVFASNQDSKIQHNIQHDTSNGSTLISVKNQKTWRWDLVQNQFLFNCSFFRNLTEDSTFEIQIGVNYFSSNFSQDRTESTKDKFKRINSNVEFLFMDKGNRLVSENRKPEFFIYYHPAIPAVWIAIHLVSIVIFFIFRNHQPLKSRGYLPLITLILILVQILIDCKQFGSNFGPTTSVVFEAVVHGFHILNFISFLFLSYLNDDKLELISKKTKKVKCRFKCLKCLVKPKWILIPFFLFLLVTFIHFFSSYIEFFVRIASLFKGDAMFAVIYFLYVVAIFSIYFFSYFGQISKLFSFIVFFSLAIMLIDFFLLVVYFCIQQKRSKIGFFSFFKKKLNDDIYHFRLHYYTLFSFSPLLFIFLFVDWIFRTDYLELDIPFFVDILVGIYYKLSMFGIQILFLYAITIYRFIKTKHSKSDKFVESKFENMLLDSDLKDEFKKFCIKEFSPENLLCYDDILIFKSLDTEESRKLKANEIKEIYLLSDSIREVNVKNSKSLLDSITNGEIQVDLFDEIILELKANMVDTYSRFIVDPEYENHQEKRTLLKNLVDVQNKF